MRNRATARGLPRRACQQCDCSDVEAVKVASAPTMYSEVVIAPMPRSVGRYQILDRLAVGGMAELFKATLTGDHGFEKLVAIKKILPHLATDRSFVEMFIDEAR